MNQRFFFKILLIGVFFILIINLVYQLFCPCFPSHSLQKIDLNNNYTNNHNFTYNRYSPIIFIGGFPRSGTTLLRVILDTHPDIRCGEETRIIPDLLKFHRDRADYTIEMRRMVDTGITPQVYDSAMASFILEILKGHGSPAPRLCDKDPFVMRSALYLRHLFPNSKIIFMIRDGRAVVHSFITKTITITDFDLDNYTQCFQTWNQYMTDMHNQCQELGPSVCLPIKYEQLVLRPEIHLKIILEFLGVPWNESVLRHQTLINNTDKISLSKLESSTDQVIKPINVESLYKWVGHIPEDVIKEMAKIAPILSTLGYDPNDSHPNYGRPDSLVLKNMQLLEQNKEEWNQKQKQISSLRKSLRDSMEYELFKEMLAHANLKI